LVFLFHLAAPRGVGENGTIYEQPSNEPPDRRATTGGSLLTEDDEAGSDRNGRAFARVKPC